MPVRRLMVAVAARGIAAVAVLSLLTFLVHDVSSTVPVTMNGAHMRVPRGVTAGVLAATRSFALPGDLRSAGEHRVIVVGAGLPVLIMVDGRVTDASAIVRAGDAFQVFSGGDAVEAVVVETGTVEAPLNTIGTGPVERVISEGAAGAGVFTIGTVSGEVVKCDPITPARPRVIRRTPAPGAPVVALTFDDGPWPGQTEAILKMLAEKDVPATFFMVGGRVKAAPEVARLVVDSGHLVGNHTYRHRRVDQATDAATRSEIALTNDEIARATGTTPRWFRPPGGHMDDAVYAEVARLGMQPALWTVDPKDWRDGVTASAIAGNVLGTARPGAVILLHDGGGEQAEMLVALPGIIDGLRAAGYGFVTLDELPSVRSRW